jgi:predicted nucleotidyltransferase
MAKKTGLTRDSIIRALTAELRPLPSVHAFWEAGAAAFNRIDEWSDIDLYIVVDDAAAVAETFLVVEKALIALSPIRLKHEVSWAPTSGIYQKFYHLAGTSEFLLVDLAVMTLSAPDKFLAREIHGDAVFLFNKGDTVRVPPLDADAFVRGLLERRRRLVERMDLFGPFVPKEIHRRNWLEALDFYRGLVIQSLVEALRMQHGPLHYDFRMRYFYRELPSDVLRRLERLAVVKDPDDLAAKYEEALAWFHEVMGAIDEKRIRAQVSDS